MLGKQTCICLLFSLTAGYFMVKNLLLKTYCSQLWMLPALSQQSPINGSQFIPEYRSYQTHVSLFGTVSLFFHNWCG